MFIGVEHLIFEWLKTRRGQVIGSIVTCLATTAAALFVVPVGLRQVRLSRDYAIVRADVIDSQQYFDTKHRDRPRSIAVRYQFIIGGRAYHYTGAGGGEFASLTVEAGETAMRERKIDVAYRPTEPANNAPATAMRWMWAWGGGMVAVPPALAALAWNWVTRVYRRRGQT